MAGVTAELVRQQRKATEAAKAAAEAAAHDEQLTRQRVELVEAWLTAWTSLGFLGRLRWLLLGSR